jgi:hypothetical protein
MPEWIEKNYKAWAASLGTGAALFIFDKLRTVFPDLQWDSDWQIAVGTALAGAIVMTFNWAFTWIFPSNKPTTANLVSAGAADSKVKTAITSAAKKLEDVTAVKH